MNILRHKSWHVRNRNNITRVRKDEEKARNEELEKDKRIALADSEKRVQILRQRLSTKSGSVATTTDVTAEGSQSHLDIFEDFDDKIRTKNKDHEKEVNEEKEKFEKKTGILQYLVDKDIDSHQNWYLDSHEKRMKLTDSKEKYTEKELKDIKAKKFNDPLEDMKRYLDSMKPKKDSKSDSKLKTNKKSIESVEKIEISSKRKSKKSKKHKKHKKKKRKRISSETSEDSDNNRVSDIKKIKTVEQLRAERLERERIERERTRALLSGKSGTQTEVVIMDERRRTYNSQFNPDIARQNLQND